MRRDAGNTDRSTFGMELRRYRLRADRTLRDLARSVNYDCGALSRIENNLRRPAPGIVRALDRELQADGALVRMAAEPVRRDATRVSIRGGDCAIGGIDLDRMLTDISEVLLNHLARPADSAAITDGSGQSVTVMDHFDRERFIESVAASRKCVQILEMWTDLLQADHSERFLNSLRSALVGGAQVRILLLDPRSRAAAQRADDLSVSADTVADWINENISTLAGFVRALPTQAARWIDLRIYSALPPAQAYTADEALTVSFFPVRTISWQTTQYLTSVRSGLGEFVRAKFEELWMADNTRALRDFVIEATDPGRLRIRER